MIFKPPLEVHVQKIHESPSLHTLKHICAGSCSLLVGNIQTADKRQMSSYINPEKTYFIT